MRERLITRTITRHLVTAVVYNKATHSVEYPYVDIIGNYNDTDLEKVVRKSVEDTDHTYIAISFDDKNEETYGMREDMFLTLAQKLDK